jgi:hypothetical protein
MEGELVNFDKIFFERKDFKKLGFRAIEVIPFVSQINGFLSSFRSLQHPDTFFFFKNKKKAFVCAVDRLEAKYHSGWLYRKEFESFEELSDAVDQFVAEFNDVRPHHAIGGMTPTELHEGNENYYTENYKLKAKEARKDRHLSNKCNACDTCSVSKKLILSYFVDNDCLNTK